MQTNELSQNLQRLAPPTFAEDTRQWATLSQQLTELTRVNQQQLNADNQSGRAGSISSTTSSSGSSDSALVNGLEKLGTNLLKGLTLYPVFNGLRNLFGGRQEAAPEPLPVFQAPNPIRAEAGIGADGRLYSIDRGIGDRIRRQEPDAPPTSVMNSQETSVNNTPMSITLNINALDSRSIMDRSDDIARAVRDAMLNSHALNDVVNDL
jgi:hypothetical protein